MNPDLYIIFDPSVDRFLREFGSSLDCAKPDLYLIFDPSVDRFLIEFGSSLDLAKSPKT